MKIFWLILLITVKSFSQNSETINMILSFENCTTESISLCGNYFEQEKMRKQVLIKLDKENYIKSYDTIYELNFDDIFKLEEILGGNIKNKYISKIKFSSAFYKIIEDGLVINNLKEKPCKKFHFINFLIKADIEKMDEDFIYILNPIPNNFDDIFIKKRAVKYKIKNLISYSLSAPCSPESSK